MKLRIVVPILGILLLLASCGTSDEQKNDANKEQKNEAAHTVTYPQLTKEIQKNEKLVEMETSMGTIKMKLFPEYAPKAVENFITHSKDGYYEGVTFHRVMKDFMIQGGDPEGTGAGGESIYGKPFEDEFSDKLFNLRGALSMANAGPSTNGSQFFIVQNSTLAEGLKEKMEEAKYPEEIMKAYEQGGTPWLDNKHTVFDQVIEGMDVVDKIASVEVDVSNNKPFEEVIIKKIKVKE